MHIKAKIPYSAFRWLHFQASKEDFIINHSIKFQDTPVRYKHDSFKSHNLKGINFSELATVLARQKSKHLNL